MAPVSQAAGTPTKEEALKMSSPMTPILHCNSKFAWMVATAVLVGSLAGVNAKADASNPEGMKAHIATATAIAGDQADLAGPLALCKTATGAPASAFMENYRRMVAEPPLAPMQVFDNLYFLGSKWTTAWAIKTSEGIIIVDAMDNAEEAEQYIEGGLRKLGDDPAQ